MRTWMLALVLVGCGDVEGQKVKALLRTHTVACVAPEGGGPAVATMEIARADTLYVAEVLDRRTNLVVGLPAVRDGVQVTFTCPDGLEQVEVRTAAILEALKAQGDEPEAEAPAPTSEELR